MLFLQRDPYSSVPAKPPALSALTYSPGHATIAWSLNKPPVAEFRNFFYGPLRRLPSIPTVSWNPVAAWKAPAHS
jgi:hypothetical protein